MSTVADRDVVIFTFTDTEEEAVDSLLDAYLDTESTAVDSTSWNAIRGANAIHGTMADGRTIRIEHKPLRVQGNVNAAMVMAREAFDDLEGHTPRTDYYIFYGCCGALDGDLIGNVYRISRASYLSLGSVANMPNNLEVQKPEGVTIRRPEQVVMHASDQQQVVTTTPEQVVVSNPEAVVVTAPSHTSNSETVRLKNKWIVRTDSTEARPLGSIEIPLGKPRGPGPLFFLDLPDAYALATDKVIKIPPAPNPPQSADQDELGHIFEPAEWSYGEALAHSQTQVTNKPVLIDMETYGIASAMRAMRLEERVIVLRVVTDALSNKEGQPDEDQLQFLKNRLSALAAVLTAIMEIADDAT